MHYCLITKKRFRKAMKKLPMADKLLLTAVIEKLLNGETLDKAYKNHRLKGDKAGKWDCHIKNDLVLLYEIDDDKLILTAIDVGSHSYLGID